MKKIFFPVILFLFSFTGCLDFLDNPTSPVVDTPASYESVTAALDALPAYSITLEGVTDNGNGTYTWLWRIVNTKPGNGKNGTTQDLSHWDMTLGSCLLPEHLVSAAYGTDLGNMTSFTPAVEVDPSTDCTLGLGVIKFGFGTSGSTPSYYALTINQNFLPALNSVLYYKSGKYTGCGQMNFEGIGCPTPEVECTDETGFGGESQGAGSAWWYYFDTQNTTSPQNIYAGQNFTAGTFVINGDDLVITLADGWSLRNIPQPVKVQGYNTIPNSRPPAGQFTRYKGTSLTVPMDGSRYYIIHLDLQHCE